MKSQSQKPGGLQPLIDAGANAAAQGVVRSTLLTKLLPFAGLAALAVRLFGKHGGAETRPAAGKHHRGTQHGHSIDIAWSRQGGRAPSIPVGLGSKGGAAS